MGFRGVLIFLAMAVVAVAAAYVAYRGVRPSGTTSPAASAGDAAPGKPGRSAAGERRAQVSEPEPPHLPPPPAEPPPAPAAIPEVPPATPGEARVALVIDDLGRSVEEVEDVEALGVPVTYAVLPFEARTEAVVAELSRRRAEILLHLPMQGHNGANPGPGALTVAMGDQELVNATRAALAAVPGAVGVNNHMGSVFTADERSMRAVLGVLVERRLFFLDSRTAADTVGYRVAAALDLPAAERQVFLDPDPRPDAIRFQFARLLNLARERGYAVAIGHPHPATLDVLREEIPEARARGYEFVPVSFLLDRTGLPP